MTNSTDKTDKKVKLVFSPDLFKAAKFRADRAGQPLEDWVLALIEQHVHDKNSVQGLDWGRIDSRIDSRIDQRTIFLERRLEVLAERVDQLLRQPSLSTEATAQSLSEVLDNAMLDDAMLDDTISDRIPMTGIETQEGNCSRLTA